MSRPSRVRVDLLNISLDGFAAGTTITLDHPIGGAELLFAHFDGRFIRGVQSADAPITADRAVTGIWGQGVGVEIMGRGKFGPQTGPWSDDEWRGWWDDEPPFQTPVVVLTHHPREPIEFANGTTFYFVDASPADALAQARRLADGGDIRIGGGPSTVRSFLDADLIDFMHLTVEPIVLGEGVNLWEGLGGIQTRFDVEVIASRSGLVHQFWNRLGRSGE